MADRYTIGQGHKAFFGRTAPTTPTDPESSSVLAELAEIGDALTFNQGRSNAERRGRNDPNARYLHPGDRVEDFSIDTHYDLDGNTAAGHIQSALRSDTDGVGASGNVLYFVISNNVAGDLLIHGQCAPTSVPFDLGRQSVIAQNMSFDVNGDSTVTTHAA